MVKAFLDAQYPELAIRVVNKGNSGNTVRDLETRWQDDVLDLSPDWVSIMIGVNDYWHTVAFGSKYKGTVESYGTGFIALLERTRTLEKELERLKQKLASSAGSDLASQAVPIDGLQVLAARLDGTDPKSLRGTVDQLKQKLGTAAIILAAVNDDRISLVAGVSDDATDRIKAGELVNAVATPIGGKGGGRADMAQGGGSDVGALDGALANVTEWVKDRLN